MCFKNYVSILIQYSLKYSIYRSRYEWPSPSKLQIVLFYRGIAFESLKFARLCTNWTWFILDGFFDKFRFRWFKMLDYRHRDEFVQDFQCSNPFYVLDSEIRGDLGNRLIQNSSWITFLIATNLWSPITIYFRLICMFLRME